MRFGWSLEMNTGYGSELGFEFHIWILFAFYEILVNDVMVLIPKF